MAAAVLARLLLVGLLLAQGRCGTGREFEIYVAQLTGERPASGQAAACCLRK